VEKIRAIFVSKMKTTVFYTATFLAFLLANSSMAMSKIILHLWIVAP